MNLASKLSAALALGLATLLSSCGPQDPEVVVYTALDRGFSEPVFERFEQRTGIRVRPVFDVESTKTIGLVNRLRAEARSPRCDVFWNNEIVNTLALLDEGLLEPAATPTHAERFPSSYRDPAGNWFGFAARARVLLVNTELVPPSERPSELRAMVDPKWRGQVAMAKPLFGTTATHMAQLRAHWGAESFERFLQDLRTNEVQIHAGNKGVARAVSEGRAAIGLTDTDDAIIELEAGKPVAILLPTPPLLIPNSLARVAGAPHPEAADALIDFLLSPEVEQSLALGPSAQIPLHPDVNIDARVPRPTIEALADVDFQAASNEFDAALLSVERILLAP